MKYKLFDEFRSTIASLFAQYESSEITNKEFYSQTRKVLSDMEKSEVKKRKKKKENKKISKKRPVCRNCKHRIFWDDIDEVWVHKHRLHNDNCECRKPVRSKG